MNQNKKNHPNTINQEGDELVFTEIGEYFSPGRNIESTRSIYLLLPNPVGVIKSGYSQAMAFVDEHEGLNKLEQMENITQGYAWIGLKGSFDQWKPIPSDPVKARKWHLEAFARQSLVVDQIKDQLALAADLLEFRAINITKVFPPHHVIAGSFVVDVDGETAIINYDQDGEHNHKITFDVCNWTQEERE